MLRKFSETVYGFKDGKVRKGSLNIVLMPTNYYVGLYFGDDLYMGAYKDNRTNSAHFKVFEKMTDDEFLGYIQIWMLTKNAAVFDFEKEPDIQKTIRPELYGAMVEAGIPELLDAYDAMVEERVIETFDTIDEMIQSETFKKFKRFH